MNRSALANLRRTPGYPPFVAAATLARLADEMFSVGVVLLVLDRTGSATLAGLTVAAVTLPGVITGPLLGAWLDRTGRRVVIMAIDQVLMACALIGIVAAAGNAPDFVVPLCALVAGVTYPLSFGGFTSLIPAIVPERLLEPANALEVTSFNAALVTGPALAGTIAAVAAPAASLVVQALLTLAALPLILRLPEPGRDEPDDRRSLVEIAASGFRHVLSTPQLRGVTATGALSLAGLGLLTVAFPLFAVEELGAPRSSAGYMWAAFAVGSTFGALALVRLQRACPSERVVLGAVASFGALMLLWPLAGTLPVVLVLIALAGVADGPGLAATFATRQRLTPHEMHGQVFTTAASLKVGSFALGAALAGPAVTSLGAGGALLAAAAAQFVAVAAGGALMLSPGKVRRPAPAG